MVFHPPRRPTTTTETQTSKEQGTVTPVPTSGPQLPPKAIAGTPMASAAPALASAPMATAPASCHSRPVMPSPPKRHLADDIAEGSPTKQKRTPAASAARSTGTPRVNTGTAKKQTENYWELQKSQSRQNKERRLQLTPVKMQQSKSMAETPCGSPLTDRTSPQHSRTQHLHDRSTQLLCFGLRRRPSHHWRGTDRQQALQGDSTAFATSTNRHPVSRKRSSIPWQDHHQQRRRLWD